MSQTTQGDRLLLAAAAGAAAGAAAALALSRLASRKKRPESVKLTYFDIEGAAEPVRLALTLAGIEFDDVGIKFSDWGAMKSRMPTGQVPVMEVDGGEMRTQSGAMLRWAGSMDPAGKLYPPDRLYEIEEAIGLVGDVQRSWSPNLYISMRPANFGYPEDYGKTEDGKKKIESMRKRWIEEELPTWLGYLERMMDKNGGEWLAGGDGPTVADCAAVPVLRNFTRGHIDHVDVGCVRRASPKMADYVERFCALEGIAGRYDSGIGGGKGK